MGPAAFHCALSPAARPLRQQNGPGLHMQAKPMNKVGDTAVLLVVNVVTCCNALTCCNMLQQPGSTACHLFIQVPLVRWARNSGLRSRVASESSEGASQGRSWSFGCHVRPYTARHISTALTTPERQTRPTPLNAGTLKPFQRVSPITGILPSLHH